MQGLIQSRLESEPAVSGTTKTAGFPFVPRPRTLGSFIILVTALAFVAGWLRNELALTLLGTVFLAVLAYCFLGVFFLGVLNRRKAGDFSIIITTKTVNAGKEGELCVKANGGNPLRQRRFFKLPVILARCELCLETRDGRVIRHYTCPGAEEYSRFPVKERGAYYGESDRFIIFDAPGFFRLSFPLRKSESPRLLALPAPAGEAIRFQLKPGGSEQRNDLHYRKTDELTNHRPYVPGDDPRRINWKLSGHAPLGELFVREGENEPPPHSRLLILVDTEADRSLYTVDNARGAVDMLCENALAAALELSGQGMDILVGYTGGGIIGEKDGSGPLDAAKLAEALAMPAAVFWPVFSGNLPEAPRDRGVLILALPRTSSEPSALDKFLKNRKMPKQGFGQEADIVFLYNAGSERAAELEKNAKICVSLYNGKSGARARMAVVSSREAALPKEAALPGGDAW